MATGIRFGSIYDELIGDGKYDIIFKQAQLFIQNFKSPIFDDEEPVYINSGSGIIGISKKKKKPNMRYDANMSAANLNDHKFGELKLFIDTVESKLSQPNGLFTGSDYTKRGCTVVRSLLFSVGAALLYPTLCNMSQ